jgi:hypothetical protein
MLSTISAPQRQDGTHIGAGWSSPVARQAHNLKVVGSNPTPATNFSESYEELATMPGYQSGAPSAVADLVAMRRAQGLAASARTAAI